MNLEEIMENLLSLVKESVERCNKNRKIAEEQNADRCALTLLEVECLLYKQKLDRLEFVRCKEKLAKFEKLYGWC